MTGAGRPGGIGAVICRALAREGASLFFTHLLFEGKKHMEPVVGNDRNGLARFNRADHCRFRNIRHTVPNGMETFRIWGYGGNDEIGDDRAFFAIEHNVFERDYLMEQVWGVEYESDDKLNTHMNWVRERLAALGSCVMIQTVRGVGYRHHYLLELEEIEALVVNAQHIKNVPGRKTDVKDAEWIAGLLRHGLLKGSYIPNREQRELRELIRYRRSLIEERAREVSRIQKVLKGANIKLSSVASNVLGKSGRAMIEAMIAGETDPEALLDLAKRKLKNKKADLKRALNGLMGPHQKLMLGAQLRHVDYLDEEIGRLDEEIKRRMLPFEEDLELLDTIPGVARRTAETILAEIGPNMDQYPSAAHLCSWAGLCPGQNESAGKRISGKTRKGNKKLRSTLVEAAKAAARTKETYLSSQYHRIAARRGANRATVAVAHSILSMAYYILKRRQPYIELGLTYYEERKRDVIIELHKETRVIGCFNYSQYGCLLIVLLTNTLQIAPGHFLLAGGSLSYCLL